MNIYTRQTGIAEFRNVEGVIFIIVGEFFGYMMIYLESVCFILCLFLLFAFHKLIMLFLFLRNFCEHNISAFISVCINIKLYKRARWVGCVV